MEPCSKSFPVELAEIEGRPERIWVAGRTELLDRKPRIAIVGSRSPTPYGEAQARRFAWALAESGACIVSGLARGVDHAAHQAALDAKGATIAVLGSGVDVPWPTGNLTDEVARRGLLLSEFHPGQAPRPHHFPLRNRIISGLCVGVLVIEAAHASGSLITARWAADQGRSVWAVPGRVDHPMSRGAHRLIREGATLVESPDEIVRELFGTSTGPEIARSALPGGISSEALRVVECLAGETLTADEISARSGLGLQPVLAALVELEVADCVLRAPGGLYRLTR